MDTKSLATDFILSREKNCYDCIFLILLFIENLLCQLLYLAIKYLSYIVQMLEYLTQSC